MSPHVNGFIMEREEAKNYLFRPRVVDAIASDDKLVAFQEGCSFMVRTDIGLSVGNDFRKLLHLH